MKILLINKFFYRKGGAETVFFDTAKLLQDKGHEVSFFSMHHKNNEKSAYEKYFISNVDYESYSLKNSIQSSGRILYSIEAIRNIEKLIDDEKPDIVHLHNIYHQISPSFFSVLKKKKIPIVMTLHDYKLVCASYSMLNNLQVCELCRNGKYYNCFIKGCVKNSRAKSLLNTIEMYLHHKIIHVYNLVDCYISPSQFLKNKVMEMGFSGKIKYLPNFIQLAHFKPQYDWKEQSFVYFGRLSHEKGLLTMIKAVKDLNVKLKIIGDGPQNDVLQSIVRNKNIQNISFLGFKSGNELKDEIGKSMAVIVPSEWYENNPMSVIEAFALGKPVIGARIGGIPELVIDDETGLTFEAGSEWDLREKISNLLNNLNAISKMGRNARFYAESRLSEETHYQGLMDVYHSAITA
jgi:glycosyltransferase involved in cell wall biosynthesis